MSVIPKDDEYFLEVCDSLGFGLLTVDCELRILYWNKQATRHIVPYCEDLGGRYVLDIIPEIHREAARKLFESAIQTKVSGEVEIKYEDAEGKKTTIVMIVSTIVDAEGHCAGASASLRDISERKRLSQELSRARQMASLGNMAAGVAHHFNNIMGGMLTSIDYVMPSDSPRELRRTLRLISQEIGRATRITKQLEAFAESEHDHSERSDLNLLVKDFIARLRPAAEQAQIQLVTGIEPVSPVAFPVHRLLPILDSLTHNAFDAMTPGGMITLGLREDHGEAVVTVVDTGCGISDEAKEHLFEPFFTTKGELGGGEGKNVGLGLAAVHGLVSEMGGRISISSKVGRGTTVEVRLPLASE